MSDQEQPTVLYWRSLRPEPDDQLPTREAVATWDGLIVETHQRIRDVLSILDAYVSGRLVDRVPGIIFGSPAPWLVETVRDAWSGAPQGMTRPDLIVVVAEAIGVRLDAFIGGSDEK